MYKHNKVEETGNKYQHTKRGDHPRFCVTAYSNDDNLTLGGVWGFPNEKGF
ncbi:hypothetical protein [Psychrobacter sp.]|uniref:hypothetical protein n=1 Tax=Psychrobacter sp. TaxID=56811 RepID=UPI003F9B2803